MRTRYLPPDEWSRLVEVPLPAVEAAATLGVVIAVEQDDAVIGSCAIFQCVHMEAAWIHPAHRGKAAVARRLILKAKQTIETLRAKGALTIVVPGSDMAAIWTRRGASRVSGEQLLVTL